jgi:exosortase A-associated hydrolase 2
LSGDAPIAEDAFFLPVGAGRRFCVFRSPLTPMRGVVLHVPPFAEEMNKSRRVTAAASRSIAGKGFGVLQIDLYGTGDSSGDFSDATWEAWGDDLYAALKWLRGKDDGQVWLWSLRAGALLIDDLIRKMDFPPALMLWQPVLSGSQYFTQFLRLRIAADALAQKQPSELTRGLRDEARANGLEVAGYRVSSELARGLEASGFSPSGAHISRVAWYEIQNSETPQLSPVARSRIENLRSAGAVVKAEALRGPSFWQTMELEDCPALIEASSAVFASD